MSTSTQPLRLEQLAVDPGLAAPRRAALQRALAAGLPINRDENWRYASVRGLDRQVFSPAPPPDAERLRRAAASLPPPLEGHARLVVVDGWLCDSLSVTPRPYAVSVSDDPTAGEPAAGPAAPVDRRLSQLNAALSPQALHIELARGEALDLEVVFVATLDGSVAAAHPSLRARIAETARLRLVERHLDAGDVAPFGNVDLRFDVAPRGSLHLVRLQRLGARARHFETLSIAAGDAAECEVLSVSAGAQAARSTAMVELRGRDASLRWHAVALADGNQVNDAFVRVEHFGPGARTEQAFRGIAAGRSRVAFNGHMLVREGALGCASAQSLKALLAGPEAEADLRPQLEIYVDEVRASHGATVGKLDEQMRFYLLSRGIDRDTADALLKWAFVEDVVSRITLAPLRRQVEELMATQLRSLVDVGAVR